MVHSCTTSQPILRALMYLELIKYESQTFPVTYSSRFKFFRSVQGPSVFVFPSFSLGVPDFSEILRLSSILRRMDTIPPAQEKSKNITRIPVDVDYTTPSPSCEAMIYSILSTGHFHKYVSKLSFQSEL